MQLTWTCGKETRRKYVEDKERFVFACKFEKKCRTRWIQANVLMSRATFCVDTPLLFTRPFLILPPLGWSMMSLGLMLLCCTLEAKEQTYFEKLLNNWGSEEAAASCSIVLPLPTSGRRGREEEETHTHRGSAALAHINPERRSTGWLHRSDTGQEFSSKKKISSIWFYHIQSFTFTTPERHSFLVKGKQLTDN